MSIEVAGELSMADMAVIKVPRAVRDDVRDAARAANLTPGQLIEQMLQARRHTELRTALETETPDHEYLDDLAEVDAVLLPDTEESIAQYEAGE
ncbi:hypothetical protein [Propionimicrobium sp. PCR01-08-3]|uniref:hypothetical protein n=1 Tax=Propionimicrobium sp. PCR01-08-3 TaxID=3052086 RepID=UPI00255C2C78|nr:hypothetical protein [Propionimicrobium sp. PCR01-08-3]WIY82370.1 hypothetical protein QQ658_12825 [Propionimicrobium sp. PCR01-08-3]